MTSNNFIKAQGMLHVSDIFVKHTFGLSVYSGEQYIMDTDLLINRLITLLENNGAEKEINKLINNLIQLQNSNLEKYYRKYRK